MATLSPVLMGNAPAVDAVTSSKLTLTSPLPIQITPFRQQFQNTQQHIVLDSQGDSSLVFIQNPGTSSQTQTRLSLGTQMNDSEWVRSTLW